MSNPRLFYCASRFGGDICGEHIEVEIVFTSEDDGEAIYRAAVFDDDGEPTNWYQVTHCPKCGQLLGEGALYPAPRVPTND